MKENFINYIPLKVYRRLRWECEQKKNYTHIMASYGKEYAQMCYQVEKAIYLRHPTDEILHLQKKRDNFILENIKRQCEAVLQRAEQYQMESVLRNADEPIWVFWWTGEDDAPEIVKICIRSIRCNANGHRVIVIDKNNIQKYVHLPDYIEEKHNNGKIGHAHYSDMVRLSLLSQYGGVWIDATVFVSQPLPEFLFEKEFYTAKTVDNQAFYFSRSRWVGYFLAGSKTFPLFAFARDMLLEYWKKTDVIISYLLMDYIFDITCQVIPSVKNVMDQLPDNNPDRGALMNRINEPYSKALFDMLQNGSTFLSKLSWRYGNPTAATKSGEKTNYGHLLDL